MAVAGVEGVGDGCLGFGGGAGRGLVGGGWWGSWGLFTFARPGRVRGQRVCI